MTVLEQAMITAIPKVWTIDDITTKIASFNKATMLGSEFAVLDKWEECRVDNKGDLDLAISVKPALYNNRQLEIESHRALSDKEIQLILEDVNARYKYNPDIGLLYDSSIILMAMSVKKTHTAWIATPECIERMATLGINELRAALEVKEKHSIIFSVGNYLFYSTKNYATKPLMALVLDYYADRAIPVPEGFQGVHKEATFEGIGLMMRLLGQTLGQSGMTEYEIKHSYEALKDKNFIPNVPLAWNSGLIELIKTGRLQDLFKDFMNLNTLRKSVPATSLREAIQQRFGEVDAEIDEIEKAMEDGFSGMEPIELQSTQPKNASDSNDYELSMSLIVHNEHWQVTDITVESLFLSEILLNKLNVSEVSLIYSGKYPVIPDMNIEIGFKSQVLRLPDKHIICGMVEDGTLQLVIDDHCLDDTACSLFESVLTAEQNALEEVLIIYNSSNEGIELQKVFNSMITNVTE